MKYRILAVGPVADPHFIRFVRHLKTENNDANIEVLTFSVRTPISDDLYKNVSETHLIKTSDSGGKFSELVKVWHLRREVKSLSHSHKYDLIVIHYPQYYYSFCVDYFTKMSRYIVLSPWGSDVYRIGKINRFLLKRLYDKADYVGGAMNRFHKDVQKIFRVDDSKMVLLGMGSDLFDVIAEHSQRIDTNKARKALGLEGAYFITCGYGASASHNHQQVLEAISKVKDKLPQPLTILFPVTYPKNDTYISQLKEWVKELGLNGVFFTEFLDNLNMFMLRQSTDMYIHMPISDASSATLKEYILLGKKVINASWLFYDELERGDRKPYLVTKDFDTLPQTILEAYNSEGNTVDEDFKNLIKTKGWNYRIKLWNDFFCGLLEK